jgi:hypothetical protein
MGFLFKSAIGLGCVYFAMFSQALRSSDLTPTANLCAAAVKADIGGEPGLRAKFAAAGCAVALETETKRLAPPAPAARPAPSPPPPASQAPAKRLSGTLTADDLRDPWFGPGRAARKASGRG